MADYTELKAAIRAAIFDNTEQAITGESLQEILVKMVDELGESYVLPEGGIPASDLAQAVRDALAEAVSAYQLPVGGIPEADLAQAVRNALAAGLSAYQKPQSGIPETDLAQAVRDALAAALSAYQKPQDGIPASDMAPGVIPNAVEANPTVPSGTTPTTLTTMKIGSEYYSAPQGPQGLQGPQGPQGEQGNTGSSVDYPYELVNNLTTDDATKGLSAAQGVVLDGKISQLGQEVNGKEESTIDFTQETNEYGIINPENPSAWMNRSMLGHYMLNVNPGDKFVITSLSDQYCHYAVLKERPTYDYGSQLAPSTSPVYSAAEGFTTLEQIGGATSKEITIPNDGHCLYLESGTYRPSSAVSPEIVGLDERVASSENSIEAINKGLLNAYLVGNGNTFAYRNIYGLKPGNKYRITFKNPDWDMTGVTVTGAGGYDRLQIQNVYNTVNTTLFNIRVGSDVPPYYDVVIPNNSDYIIVRIRATANEIVYFNCSDITQTISLSTRVGIAQLRDGTHGNPGNANSVTTEVMRTFGAKYILIQTTRPNASGCRYRYGWAITSSENDIGTLKARGEWQGLITAVDPSGGNSNCLLDLSNYPTAVGVCITFNEVNGSNVSQVLRTTDFEEFSCGIVRYKQVEDIVDPIVRSLVPEIIDERERDGQPYFGERIKLNIFKVSNLKTISSLGWNQSAVFYDNYGVFFNDQNITAKVIDMTTGAILATLSLPYGSYYQPHCNTASIGKEKANTKSIMPPIYVSQWYAGYQKACFVYDIQLDGGVYTISLIQKINLSAVTTMGSGPCDFVVDTDNDRIIAFAYKTMQSIDNGTNLMLCTFPLPALTSDEIIVGDSDISQVIEAENIPVRQDAFYNNGRVFIASGLGNGEKPAFVTAVRISDGQQVSKIPLGDYFGEPEAFDVYDNQIVFTKGDGAIYILTT